MKHIDDFPADNRTLPHSLDAERAVLGGVLLHGDRLADAAEFLEPRHFFRTAHSIIFAHMLKLAEAQVNIDFLTLRDALTTSGKLNAVDGPAYLSSLIDGIPRSMNIGDHARIVRSKAQLRDLIYVATRVFDHAYNDDEDPRVVVDRLEQDLFAVSQGNARSGFRRLSEIMPGVLEQIERWNETKLGISGIPSGFAEFDDMTRGFQPSNLIILAARPSMGKSAIVLNIAQHNAKQGKSVGIFSLEMSEMELAVRTLTAEAGVDGHRLQRGYLGTRDWSRISEAHETLMGLNLWIDESPFITVFEMRARARRLKAEKGLDLLVIDYTQLMVSTERRENRTQELGAISRSLKALAKDLKIPIIALSQLSRKCEERTNKRPLLSDLRESGALEQDADVVVFIYRDAVYGETDVNRNAAELIIAKHRNGPIGTVHLAWIPEETRFDNLSALAPQPADQRLPIGDRS